MSGLDVKSLITIPETDTDSALEADDVDLEEKDLDSCSRETTTVKTVVCMFLIICGVQKNIGGAKQFVI